MRSASNKTEQKLATKSNSNELGPVVEELRQSEEQYRLLFNSVDQAYCIIELIYNEDGKPIDILCIEANPAFEKQIGYVPSCRKVS